MALLHMDGFSSYLHLTHNPAYWIVYYPAVRDDSIGRHGSGGMRFESYDWNAGLYVVPPNMDASTLIVGFNIIRYHSANPFNLRFRNMFGGDGTDRNLCQFKFYDNRIEVWTEYGVTQLTTYNIDLAAWTYIEIKVTFGDGTGTFALRAEGIDILSVDALNQHTNQPLVDPAEVTRVTCDALYFYPDTPYQSSDNTATISDFYIADDTGATNNNYIGPVKIDAFVPVAQGASADYALPGTLDPGTAHYTMVNNALVKSTVQHTEVLQQQSNTDVYFYNRNTSTIQDGSAGGIRLWCYDYAGYGFIKFPPLTIPRTATIISAELSLYKYDTPLNWSADSSWGMSARLSFIGYGVEFPPTTENNVWNIANNYYYDYGGLNWLWTSANNQQVTLDISRFIRMRMQYDQWNEEGESICVGLRTHNCPSNYTGANDYLEWFSRYRVGTGDYRLPTITVVWEEGDPVMTDSYLETDTIAQAETFDYDLSGITDPILAIKHSATGQSVLNLDRSVKHKTISGVATAEKPAHTHRTLRADIGSGIFEVDPNTGLPWTTAGADAAEFGVETE